VLSVELDWLKKKSVFGTSLEQLGGTKAESNCGLAQPLQQVSSLTGTHQNELAKQMLSQLSYTPV
jgi:hypothetical protein